MSSQRAISNGIIQNYPRPTVKKSLYKQFICNGFSCFRPFYFHRCFFLCCERQNWAKRKLFKRHNTLMFTFEKFCYLNNQKILVHRVEIFKLNEYLSFIPCEASIFFHEIFPRSLLLRWSVSSGQRAYIYLHNG